MLLLMTAVCDLIYMGLYLIGITAKNVF